MAHIIKRNFLNGNQKRKTFSQHDDVKNEEGVKRKISLKSIFHILPVALTFPPHKVDKKAEMFFEKVSFINLRNFSWKILFALHISSPWQYFTIKPFNFFLPRKKNNIFKVLISRRHEKKVFCSLSCVAN